MMTTGASTRRQNWEKADVVTKSLKNVIDAVVSESLKKQHATLLSEINAICSQCHLDTLKPGHTKINDICPLQQNNCNCLNVQGKQLCPNNFCSAMYDKIIEQHRFKSPNWRTTDIKQWHSNYIEMGKCFIPMEKRTDECIELLYVFINNVALLGSHDPALKLLTRIKDAQIKIFNSQNKEIEESTLEQYKSDVTKLLLTKWFQKKKSQIDSSDIDGEERENHQKIQAQDTAIRRLEKNQQKTNNELGEIKERLFVIEESHHVLKENHINLARYVDQLSTILSNLEKQKDEIQSIEKEDSARSVPMKSECEETPVISRPLDGRLIILDSKQIGALMKVCETKVLEGGFGSVFVSNSKVPELDVRVVIKKIICTENDRIKKLSTLNEKIAARVMHFAVVPLIAYAEEQLEDAKRAYYFLSPYLEYESLRGLIEKDRKCLDINNVMMKCVSRIQILFQVASALDYLHSPLPGYRGIILHMDVTTMNIVCDKHFNARLIDFGLAREMNEGKQEVSYTESMSFGTRGYFPTIRYSSLTVQEDYYNFGVVIRELLTGDLPYIDSGKVEADELRKCGEDVIKKTQQNLIWQDEKELAQGILQLSTRCLESRVDKKLTPANIVKELKNLIWQDVYELAQGILQLSTRCFKGRVNKKLTSADIVKELKTMLGNTYQRKRPEADEPEAGKCDLCMVNVAVDDGYSPPHKCNGCKMKICVSCMRNSHINPIRCPTCNEEVIPEIGHTFAALLIAGNDLKEKEFAASFKREINEIKDVLASKYPCVIGIRDENIKTITPSKPGESEKLLPQVLSAFEFFQGLKNIKTLLIYFSGHHSSKTGFVLGCRDDVLPVEKLNEFLVNLSKFWKNKARTLIFLDCCFPPSLNLNTGMKTIQINVCSLNYICIQTTEDSYFQKFFVQALTRKIYKKKCYGIGERSGQKKECEDCTMSGDFISCEQLLKYISDHVNKFTTRNEPVLNTQGVSWCDAIIGYNVDFAVDLSLKFEAHSQESIDVKLDQEMHSDIDELKLRILQKVTCREDVKLKLSDEFADVISLRIHTGSENGKELSTMLQFDAAMSTKRDIIASYRTVSNIGIGRVAMFTPTGCIYQYFDGKKMLKKTDRERIEANLSLTDLDKVTDDIQGRPDLKTWYETLFAVYKAWKKETNKERKELKVIFPENRNDFVVLHLAEKETFQWLKKLAHLIMKRQYIILSLFALLVAIILYIFM